METPVPLPHQDQAIPHIFPASPSMGLLAKQYAASGFNWDRIARQTIGVCRSMLQGRALPALDGSREAAYVLLPGVWKGYE